VASPDPALLTAPATVGGALVMLFAAGGIAAWGYIRSKLIPKEAAIVGGVIGGNDLRLIVEGIARVQAVGERAIDMQEAVRDSTDRVERSVRDLTSSNERTAQAAAMALIKNADETRRVADRIDALMRLFPPAAMPPGRWTDP
jgi:hypothetical protein